MPKLIKDRQVVEDEWLLVKDKTIDSATNLPKEEYIIVPLQVWQNCRNELLKRNNIGVWLDSDEPPVLLRSDIGNLPLIAINFPVFSDGRGYSYAHILREEYQFSGELRAIGDILRDQLFYMKRCGFNSFVMRENERSNEALASLQDFTQSYQAASDTPDPLFRRR